MHHRTPSTPAETFANRCWAQSHKRSNILSQQQQMQCKLSKDGGFFLLNSNVKSKSSSRYWELKGDRNDYQMQKRTMEWLQLFSPKEYLDF